VQPSCRLVLPSFLPNGNFFEDDESSFCFLEKKGASVGQSFLPSGSQFPKEHANSSLGEPCSLVVIDLIGCRGASNRMEAGFEF